MNEVVEVRNDVVDRAAGVAVGRAAVETAGTLLTDRFVVQGNDELPVVTEPLPDREIGALLALEVTEPGRRTHQSPPPAASTATAACCSSPSARRYSIGMTATNLGKYSSNRSRMWSARELSTKVAWRSSSVRSRQA